MIIQSMRYARGTRSAAMKPDTPCYSVKAGEGMRSWISSVLFVAW